MSPGRVRIVAMVSVIMRSANLQDFLIVPRLARVVKPKKDRIVARINPNLEPGKELSVHLLSVSVLRVCVSECVIPTSFDINYLRGQLPLTTNILLLTPLTLLIFYFFLLYLSS